MRRMRRCDALSCTDTVIHQAGTYRAILRHNWPN